MSPALQATKRLGATNELALTWDQSRIRRASRRVPPSSIPLWSRRVRGFSGMRRLSSRQTSDEALEPKPVNQKMLWGGRREMATSSLQSNRWSAAMPQPNDLSRSLVALDHNSTIIAVVELSQSSWLVGGVLPGIE